MMKNPETTRKEQTKLAGGKGAVSLEKPLGAKQEKIIKAARKLFLEHGYTVTSMDSISDESGVSKATLYSYYASKNDLFVEIVRDLLNRHPAIIHEDANESDVQITLLRIGRSIVSLMLVDDDVAAHRMVVAEAARSPKLGRLYYEVAPVRLLTHLEHILKNAVKRGQLEIEDVEQAAVQFVGLVRGNLQLKALLCVQKTISASARDVVIKSGVEVFYRAYRPDQKSGRR